MTAAIARFCFRMALLLLPAAAASPPPPLPQALLPLLNSAVDEGFGGWSKQVQKLRLPSMIMRSLNSPSVLL